MVDNNIKFGYKFISLIYDSIDFFYFPDKNKSPRYGLVSKIKNDNLKILDICIGTATTSILLAKKNDQNNIIGIDLSKEMLKIANNKIKKNNIENISVLYMDATKTVFNDQEFDIITMSLGLHEMDSETLSLVLKEINRILKNNGILYIIEWEKPDNGLLKKIMFQIIKFLEPKWFNDFLRINWQNLLANYNFDLTENKKYSYTKLLTVTKVM
ncbi:MAG TPA: class I SAM-dependent methyltransferase [Spirochaetota bacterium]|nr:class I SAM-dependent methyltransferase [Spirochaetota bacterium]